MKSSFDVVHLKIGQYLISSLRFSSLRFAAWDKRGALRGIKEERSVSLMHHPDPTRHPDPTCHPEFISGSQGNELCKIY